MSTQNNKTAKGFGNPQNRETTASTSAQSSPDSAPKDVSIDSRIASMRSKVKQSLHGFAAAADELRGEYREAAQPIVDEFSQDLFDMITGREMISAVTDNVAFMLTSIQMVEKPSLGEPNSSRLSLKRFKPDATQNSSNSTHLLGEQK